jgi:hypothetical protein
MYSNIATSFLLLISAPLPINRVAISVCPFSAALYNGVYPSYINYIIDYDLISIDNDISYSSYIYTNIRTLSLLLTSTLLLINRDAISVCPFIAASRNGVSSHYTITHTSNNYIVDND